MEKDEIKLDMIIKLKELVDIQWKRIKTLDHAMIEAEQRITKLEDKIDYMEIHIKSDIFDSL